MLAWLMKSLAISDHFSLQPLPFLEVGVCNWKFQPPNLMFWSFWWPATILKLSRGAQSPVINIQRTHMPCKILRILTAVCKKIGMKTKYTCFCNSQCHRFLKAFTLVHEYYLVKCSGSGESIVQIVFIVAFCSLVRDIEKMTFPGKWQKFVLIKERQGMRKAPFTVEKRRKKKTIMINLLHVLKSH